MNQSKDILQQEPQIEPVAVSDLSEVGGYIVYISLDYLDFVFADLAIQCDRDAQKKFIEELQHGICEILSDHKGNVIYTWMWHQADGTECCALKVIPVSAKSEGVTIVTPDVTGYERLNKIIEGQRLVINELQLAIKKLREDVRHLGNRIDS